jgi:hypothetical protein
MENIILYLINGAVVILGLVAAAKWAWIKAKFGAVSALLAVIEAAFEDEKLTEAEKDSIIAALKKLLGKE